MTIDLNIIATVFSVIASAIAIVVAISKREKTYLNSKTMPKGVKQWGK